MPRSSDARERTIDAAATLFRRRGYHGVGVAEIIAAASAPRGSFYHHFPDGKHQLALLAINRAGRYVTNVIDASFADAPSLAAGTRRLGESLADELERSGWRNGCPFTGIASGLGDGADDESLRAAIADTFERWQGRLARHARAHGLGRATAARHARGVLVALEGAWLVARVSRTRRPFADALALLDASASDG